MIEALTDKARKLSKESLWVALIALGVFAASMALGLIVGGITGIIIAITPVVLLLLLLCLVNPYPLWLIFFAAIPLAYIFSESLPTGSFVRLFGLLMVAISIPYILLTKRSPDFKMTPLGVSLLLFFAGCALSVLSFFDPAHALWGVALYFGNVVAYWVFVNIFKKENYIYHALNIFIFFFTIESVIAIVQKFVSHPLARSAGTVNDANFFGFLLLPFLCFAFYFGLAARKRWHKLLYFSAFFLMTIAIPLTYSRSMIIVLFLALFVIFWRQKKLLLFLVFCAIVAGLVYISFAGIFAKTGFTPLSFFTATRIGSITWRAYFLKTALRMFLDYPIFGVGADCFFYKFKFYSLITPRIYEPVVHDSYLEILAGTGLVGLIPFLAVLFFALRNFWKARKYYIVQGDKRRAVLMEGLLVGFGSSLASHFFLSEQHSILLWFFIAISTIMANLSFRNSKNASSVQNSA